MNPAIFIRSYNRDFEWLSYCVKSIRKYCSGFSEVVLVVPHDQVRELTPAIRECVDQVFGTKERTRGYLDQQITKLQSHHYTEAELILYVDSDCMFFEKCTPESFMRAGKPLLLKTPYAVFERHQNETGRAQNVLRWRAITEKAVGFEVDHEYMRRIPMMHAARTLKEIEHRYPHMIDHIQQIRDNGFSEFNVIGAIAERFLPDLYHIQSTETEPLPPKFCEQYWSWGGISEELRENMKCVCK